MSIITLDKFPNLCRTCLSEPINKVLIFIDDIKQVSFAEMLMQCTSLSAVKGDSLPSNICNNCIVQLKAAFSFKQLCEKSYETLKNCANPTKSDYLVNSVEENVQIKSDPVVFNGVFKPKIEVKIRENIGHIYNCTICKVTLSTRRQLAKHKLAQHCNIPQETEVDVEFSKKSLHKCPICSMTFDSRGMLIKHKFVEHKTERGEKQETRRFLCNICGKGFKQHSYLKVHINSHTGEKAYECDSCEKCFSCLSTLTTHKRTHTGERPYVCHVCGKAFYRSSTLSMHNRIHTGEKLIECPVCYKRFFRAGALTIHMRFHIGEKPFTCTKCGKSFTMKSTLTEHTRSHTGERPFICELCGQAFAQSGTLRNHFKTHRPRHEKYVRKKKNDS